MARGRGRADLAKDRGGTRRDGLAAAVLGLRLGGRPGARALRARQSCAGRGQARARFRLRFRACRDRRRASGAAAVEASDIDAFAVAAIEANAAENGVSVAPRLENLIGADEGWEVVLAGDIAYEKDLAEAATEWLGGLARRGAAVLVGDPRRAYLPLERLDCVIEYAVPVTRELEDLEIKRTGVFRFR